MHRSYNDIIDKIGEPTWWDGQGCPRYCEFGPAKWCDVYASLVALVEIQCQACEKRFHVACEFDKYELHERLEYLGIATPISKDSFASLFRYGDPPRHDCVGDTMNSELRKILQWCETSDDWEWIRRPENEIEIVDE